MTKTTNIITDKQQFQKSASNFFNILFEEALKNNCGDISIEIPNEWGGMNQSFHKSIKDAVSDAYRLCQHGNEVYVGVNPRVGRASKKENVQWLTSFHAEIDYGKAGHKKKSEYETRDDALAAIKTFEIQPTLIIHSGGGFHCYWVLKRPANVSGIGLEALENANKALLTKIKADIGTHNINRVLRVPGTFNLKIKDNPRPVSIIDDSGPQYDLEVFRPFMNFQPASTIKQMTMAVTSGLDQKSWERKVSSLPVLDKIKTLIMKGNNGSYSSRSEADQAVITALVNKGLSEKDIKLIFEKYTIGEKYRGHSSPNEYLSYNIKKAKEFSNLTEEERLNPLFISDALHKDDDNK